MAVEERGLLTTREVAALLGLSVSAIKSHIYVTRDLKADAKLGSVLVFTRETVERFRQNKRRSGRPIGRAHGS